MESLRKTLKQSIKTWQKHGRALPGDATFISSLSGVADYLIHKALLLQAPTGLLQALSQVK